MKKIIKNADGSTEEIEGTPEELAQFERERSKPSDKPNEGKSKGSKRILTDDLQRFDETFNHFDNIFKKLSEINTKLNPPLYPQYPPYVPWWEVRPGTGTGAPDPFRAVPYDPFRITWTTSKTSNGTD